MKDIKEIKLDGVEYVLTTKEEYYAAIEAPKEKVDTTSVYETTTSCGTFKYSILLNKHDEIWEGTGAVTYTKDGKADLWDNSEFLKVWHRKHAYTKELSPYELDLLEGLLKEVNRLGWLI